MSKARIIGAGGAGSTIYHCNVNLNTGGGPKKQGLVSLMGVNAWTNNAIEHRANGANRFKLFCVNQVGGIGYNRMFSPSSGGPHCANFQ
jgi:hypothetical protein